RTFDVLGQASLCRLTVAARQMCGSALAIRSLSFLIANPSSNRRAYGSEWIPADREPLQFARLSSVSLWRVVVSKRAGIPLALSVRTKLQRGDDMSGNVGRQLRIVFFGAWIGLAPVFAHAQASIVDLGTLGGPSSRAFWINEVGQIVGDSDTAAGQSHAFLWENGVLTDLGTLEGGTSSSVFTAGRMINNAGHVAANCDLQGGTVFHACLWQHGVMIDLGTLPGGTFSGANN